MKRYYIAVPQDLPDDGKVGTKSARRRYEEKVAQWSQKDWAKETEFIYWGKHELLDMHSRKENEGLAYFWFNKNEFTEKEFDEQNKRAITALGTRYTPENKHEICVYVGKIVFCTKFSFTSVCHLQMVAVWGVKVV